MPTVQQTVESSPNSHRSEAMQELNTLNLEYFLPKAKTPQRKNKIQVKRTSFVITSSAYKKEMEEKKNIKEALEQQKENNRQKRLKKKMEEQTKPKKQTGKADQKEEKVVTTETEGVGTKSSKTIEKQNKNNKTETITGEIQEDKREEKNNIIINTGLCFSCLTNITFKKLGVKCQDCTRTYHIACLNQKGLLKDFYRCGVCTVKLSMRS